MASKDPSRLYDLLASMRKNMEDLLQDAQSLVNISVEMGGEIARVLKEQMVKYYAPTIKNMIDDEKTPGSIVGLIRFLDSVPLAMTRVTPSLSDEVAPIVPDVELVNPAGTNSPIDKIPQNTSFAKPQGEPVHESKMKESLDDIFVDMKDSYYNLYNDLCGKMGEEVIDRAILNNLKLSVFDIEEAIYDIAQQNGLFINFEDFEEKYGKLNESKMKEVKLSTIKQCLLAHKDEIANIAYSKDNNKLISFVEDICQDALSDEDQQDYFNKMIATMKKNSPMRNLEYLWNIIMAASDKVIGSKKYESKMKEAVVYKVVRTAKNPCDIGKDLAKIEDYAVAEFDSAEEAEIKCEQLNRSLSPSEVEFLGTEYKVVKEEQDPLKVEEK